MMMDQKELNVQRALGTVTNYWMELEFPYKEEPAGLDLCISKIVPTFTRFYHSGVTTSFTMEATVQQIHDLASALEDMIHAHICNGGVSINIYEVPGQYSSDGSRDKPIIRLFIA